MSGGQKTFVLVLAIICAASVADGFAAAWSNRALVDCRDESE